jgi:hypothetical protein
MELVVSRAKKLPRKESEEEEVYQRFPILKWMFVLMV